MVMVEADWSEVCSLSRRLGYKLGQRVQAFDGMPGMDDYRVYSQIYPDVVYAMESPQHPKVAVKITGKPVHVYDTWHSSGSMFYGWALDQSQEFRWESLSSAKNGAYIKAEKIDGRRWRVIFSGTTLQGAVRESALFLAFKQVHASSTHDVLIERPVLIMLLLNGQNAQ